MRSKPHHEGQNLTPELQPPARERLPYRQNLGMSSKGPDGVTNRSSVASLPVDDVPFDDFGKSVSERVILGLLIRTNNYVRP